MPRLKSRAETRARVEAMRSDRARGMTFATIGRVHGCTAGFAHWAARHVQVAHMWRKWHLARLRKPEPAPLTVRQVHEICGRSQW